MNENQDEEQKGPEKVDETVDPEEAEELHEPDQVEEPEEIEPSEDQDELEGLKDSDEDLEEDIPKDQDLKAYLAEMKALESDFSDLEDLDLKEIQEMQAAIAAVKDDEEIEESIEGAEIDQTTEYLEHKESMITDFSDMDELDFDELREMREAIEGVRQEKGIEGEAEFQPQAISAELEDRIKEELAKRKEVEEEVTTPEMFLAYIKDKRDKIWYHALWYLTYGIEDHTASKALLYDVLKWDTTKSPVDPIPEHQFYFGLGYILRLNVNNKQVIRYLSGGKFKINISVKNLKEWLEEAGEPIVTKPVIEDDEKKKMFSDFLKDDFLDI